MWRGAGQQRFEVDIAVAEGAGGFAPGGGQGIREVRLLQHLAHALAATTGDRLDEQRIADFVRCRAERLVAQAGLAARNERHAMATYCAARGLLVAHGGDGGGRWPDPDQPFIQHLLREVRIFGEEAIAGVNGVGAGAARGLDERHPCAGSC